MSRYFLPRLSTKKHIIMPNFNKKTPTISNKHIIDINNIGNPADESDKHIIDAQNKQSNDTYQREKKKQSKTKKITKSGFNLKDIETINIIKDYNQKKHDMVEIENQTKQPYSKNYKRAQSSLEQKHKDPKSYLEIVSLNEINNDNSFKISNKHRSQSNLNKHKFSKKSNIGINEIKDRRIVPGLASINLQKQSKSNKPSRNNLHNYESEIPERFKKQHKTIIDSKLTLNEHIMQESIETQNNAYLQNNTNFFRNYDIDNSKKNNSNAKTNTDSALAKITKFSDSSKNKPKTEFNSINSKLITIKEDTVSNENMLSPKKTQFNLNITNSVNFNSNEPIISVFTPIKKINDKEKIYKSDLNIPHARLSDVKLSLFTSNKENLTDRSNQPERLQKTCLLSTKRFYSSRANSESELSEEKRYITTGRRKVQEKSNSDILHEQSEEYSDNEIVNAINYNEDNDDYNQDDKHHLSDYHDQDYNINIEEQDTENNIDNFEINSRNKRANKSIDVYSKNSISYVTNSVHEDFNIEDDQEVEVERIRFFSREKRSNLYILFLTLALVTNFDDGSIPAATKEIKEYLNITDELLGLLGTMAYAGSLSGII